MTHEVIVHDCQRKFNEHTADYLDACKRKDHEDILYHLGYLHGMMSLWACIDHPTWEKAQRRWGEIFAGAEATNARGR